LSYAKRFSLDGPHALRAKEGKMARGNLDEAEGKGKPVWEVHRSGGVVLVEEEGGRARGALERPGGKG